AKLDIHALADGIGQPSGLSKAEMQKISVENELGDQMFRNANLDEEPSWYEIAVECAARPDRLRDEREKTFVRDMTRRLVRGGEPTEKQRKWLRDIYARVA